MAARLPFDCSCCREAKISSASTFADGFSGLNTTSCVNVANPMNSTRTTYLPRVMPDNANFPSEFVATEYFFPVRVFTAVTLTPGSGVFPLRAEPLISYVGATAGVVRDAGAGAGGVGSWAWTLDPRTITTKCSMKMPRAIDFKSQSP